jgi:hypothetical protein
VTVSLKHAFTSNVADSGDATLVQPSNWNAEHNLTANANSLLGTVTAGSVTEITCTSAGRALLDDADASAQRTTLGLGSIATQNSNNVTITGGSITGIADLAVADGGTGASTLTGYIKGNGTAAFTASNTIPNTDITGLGTLSTQNGTFSGTSSGTNTGDQNIFQTIAVSGQSNVVADSTADTLTLVAGTNIALTTNATADSITIATSGLGTISTQNANNVSITGGSITGITDLAVVDGGTGASSATAAATNLGLGTGDSPQFAGVNIGNATDTTITRVSAGVIAVEGDTVAMLTAAQTFAGLKTFTGGIQSTANAIYNVQNANTKTVANAAVGATGSQYIGWSATGSATAVGLGNQTTGTGGVFYEGYKARGGDTTTITAAASGDDILTIRGNIYDGAAWRSSARITFDVDGAVSSGDVPGAIIFSTTSDGAGSVTDRFKIDSSGDCLVIGTSLLGYGAGSGSSVTQATSRTTGVTINNPVGRITLVSAAGSPTFASFTVTNSTVGTSDLIVVNQRTGTDLYEIHVTAVSAGSFRLSFRTTGGTTTETPTFSFAVISGSIT